MTSFDVKKELKALAKPDKAKVLAGFFKTGSGQYGAGDKFLGITVPEQRQIARKYSQLPLGDVAMLLASHWHEERLTAALILVEKFQSGEEKDKREIFQFYLAHSKGINNWDLVDLTADKIVGAWLSQKGQLLLLDKLARSANLWERRIAVIATFAFIKQGDFGPTFKLAEKLLDDPHDLIHKAVGWMLREAGKRDEAALRKFLDAHVGQMPRTMLRYAIEKLPLSLRQQYLKK